MLLRGMELHRHMNRHGHKGQKTDPQRETNELNKLDIAVYKQKPVDITVVQKDLRSNPAEDNVINVDDTRMVQDNISDANVMPKPGLRKNKLVAQYGTNFRYLGILMNGLDRVTV